jgi:tetratricopeptide (TPR) repeat protein
MRPSEKRLLLHHYARNTNSEAKMRLTLFKLVDKGVTSDEEARLKLKSKGGASAYSHLKARLKDDILNILLMQDTSKRLAQPNRAAELDCRKKVAQSHLLLLRGARIEGMKLIRSALKSADKYELLAERLQINHLLREKFLGSGTSDELIKLNQEITTDLTRYEALLKVQEKSFVLASPEFAKSLRSRSKDRQTLELIEDLNKLYKKHRLARIGFWYYMAATEYYSARKNFEEVVKLGLKFLKLVEQSPAVKSKTNIAGVNQTVGLAQLELRNYVEAKVHFSKAVTLFPVTGFNRLTGLQLLIQTETALYNIPSALKYVELALQHPRLNTRDHLRPRLLFMKSSLEFLDNDVDGSFKTLNADGYLVKQADEWNLQYRFVEMLQLLEQGDEEWLEFKLDATRKFLNRHKQLSNERARLVIDLIAYLVRHDLQVDELPDPLIERLRKSLDEEKGFEWNPTGPELVRMDLWFIRKFSILQDENSDKA